MKKNIIKNKKSMDIPIYKKVEAFLIMLFMLVLPWITRIKIIKLDDISSQYFQNTNGYTIDIFLYYKSVIVIAISVIIILMIIGDNVFPDNIIKDTPIRNKKNIKFLICILLYILMTILSGIFSKYPDSAKKGSPSELESVYVLISYMVIFLGGMNYFCYESVCRILKKFLSILMCITIVLNFIEFFYKPLLEIPLVKLLITSAKYREIADNLQVTQFTNMTSLTFYNPNYYGGFCLLLLPFAAVFFLKARNIRENIFYGIVLAGMIFATFCAKSSTSFYLMIAEIIVIVVTYYIHIFRKRKEVFIREKSDRNSINSFIYCWLRIPLLVVIMISMLIIINIITSGKIYDIGKDAASNPSYTLDKNMDVFVLSDIQLEENKLKLISDKHILTLEVNDNNLSFYDENGQDIQAVEDDGNIKLTADGFEMIKMSTNSYKQLVIDLGYEDTIEFYVSDDTFYGVGQNGSMIDTVSRKDRYGQKLYSLFTGRGYAWINTIPLLKNTIILGHGAGTYPFYFQQNDYVGLINTHGSTRFVIDKPHNMYLQTAIEEGCIAMIAIIILMVLVIVNYMKNMSLVNTALFDEQNKKDNNYLSEIASASIISIAVFIIYSLFNDSMVTVNPIFWLFLGINVSAVYGIRLLKNK